MLATFRRFLDTGSFRASPDVDAKKVGDTEPVAAAQLGTLNISTRTVDQLDRVSRRPQATERMKAMLADLERDPAVAAAMANIAAQDEAPARLWNKERVPVLGALIAHVEFDRLVLTRQGFRFLDASGDLRLVTMPDTLLHLTRDEVRQAAVEGRPADVRIAMGTAHAQQMARDLAHLEKNDPETRGLMNALREQDPSGKEPSLGLELFRRVGIALLLTRDGFRTHSFGSFDSAVSPKGLGMTNRAMTYGELRECVHELASRVREGMDLTSRTVVAG
jgi:hypothetical protein